MGDQWLELVMREPRALALSDCYEMSTGENVSTSALKGSTFAYK